MLVVGGAGDAVLVLLGVVVVIVAVTTMLFVVGGAGDAVLVLLGVVVVVVAVVPALLVVEEGRQDLWEVGAASVVLRGVGSPASLVFDEDGPDAVPVESFGCGWEGKHGCSDVGTVRSGDADGLALGSNLHHRVEGGVVLAGGVEGEWGLLTSPGAVHEELLEALLADDLEVQGGRGGRGDRGRSCKVCGGGGHLCCGLFRGRVCAFGLCCVRVRGWNYLETM